eukprot:6201015-Pleurochrysis_carterae.AAC.2
MTRPSNTSSLMICCEGPKFGGGGDGFGEEGEGGSGGSPGGGGGEGGERGGEGGAPKHVPSSRLAVEL